MPEIRNLTVTEAVDQLSSRLGITKLQSRIIYNTFISIIVETLDSGGDVKLQGIGRIYNSEIEAREYRIPTSGKKVVKNKRTKYKLSSKIK